MFAVASENKAAFMLAGPRFSSGQSGTESHHVYTLFSSLTFFFSLLEGAILDFTQGTLKRSL
jgi:hypothetical protein